MSPEKRTAPPTFFVLMHEPGPKWAKDVRFNQQPGIMEHVKYFVELNKKGQVVAGGPLLDSSGGMMITRAASLEDAKKIAGSDPAVAAGLLKVTVKEWLLPIGSIEPPEKAVAKAGEAVGSIVWHDLTVKNAEQVQQFYAKVIGWRGEAQEAEGGDFNIHRPGGGEAVAGICYARGANADFPAQWLMYVTVADADKSAARCVELGGKIIVAPRAAGENRFCVIQDPAGAVVALMSKSTQKKSP